MTSFVLRTEAEEDVGFLGFAQHEGDWPAAGPIDCVFMRFFVPVDHPSAEFVNDHTGREFKAEVSYDGDAMCVDIPLDMGSSFRLRSSPAGNRWEVTGAQNLSGTGQFL